MVAIVNSLAIFCRRRVARRQSERQVSLNRCAALPEDLDKAGRKAADLSPAEALKHQVAYSRCCY